MKGCAPSNPLVFPAGLFMFHAKHEDIKEIIGDCVASSLEPNYGHPVKANFEAVLKSRRADISKQA
jgi:hypothetical protein